MGATLIRKNQIRISEFIQALASADWTSDTLTVSAAAIADKIASEIAGVGGAMQFRGAWSTASAADILLSTGIKAGYTYVYDSGTGPAGITLETGDTLIAKTDMTSSNYLNSANWVVVQVNITGAITEANLVTQLLSHLATSNSNLLSIASGTGANAGKVMLTVHFPSVSGGSAESGKYVSGISINATTGVITVTKATLPNYHKRTILGEEMTVVSNSDNKIWKTSYKLESLTRFSVYVNGVKQLLNADGDAVASIDSDSKGKITFNERAYIPQEGDTVLCDYVSLDEIN